MSNAEKNILSFTQMFPMKCGTYQARGVLAISGQSHFVLSLNKGTKFPLEFLVVGGNFDQKMMLLNQFVSIELYVPQEISGSLGQNIVFLQKIEPCDPVYPQTIELKKNEKCGLSEKFNR